MEPQFWTIWFYKQATPDGVKKTGIKRLNSSHWSGLFIEKNIKVYDPIGSLLYADCFGAVLNRSHFSIFSCQLKYHISLISPDFIQPSLPFASLIFIQPLSLSRILTFVPSCKINRVPELLTGPFFTETELLKIIACLWASK